MPLDLLFAVAVNAVATSVSFLVSFLPDLDAFWGILDDAAWRRSASTRRRLRNG
jgi:hypothetical protein